MAPVILDPTKEAARVIIKSTGQLFLFKDTKSNNPKPHGCFVLIEYNNRFYCFSCAHVLADGYNAKALFPVGEGKFSNIGGKYIYSRLPPSKKRSDDRF